MKIWPECVPCIYNVRAREILSSKLRPGEKIEALRDFTRYYSEQIDENTSTIILATKAFRKVKELIGDEDPYREFRERSYKVAKKLAETVKRQAERLIGFEKFNFLVRASIAANMLDPGAPLGVKPEELLDRIKNLRLARDETDTLYLSLLQSEKVTYLLDNAGETLLDALVLEELYRMGMVIKIVPRGKPYQNDTTYEEAIGLGLDKYGEVVDTGTDVAGPIRTMMEEEVWRKIVDADIIISKGMANFEALTYNPPKTPVFAMLVAKCLPVATAAGIKPGEAAAFYATAKPSLLAKPQST